MPLRLDTKTILAMFNQSKSQAEDSIDKERLAEMNKAIEEKRMADDKSYHDQSLAIQQRDAEANAAFRDEQRRIMNKPYETRGIASKVFTPLQRKYLPYGDNDVITNEQYDQGVDTSTKLYGLDLQAQTSRENTRLNSLAKQMEAQQAWQLQRDAAERHQTALGQQFIQGLSFGTDPVTYKGGMFQREYQGNAQTVMGRLKQTKATLDAIDAAVQNKDYQAAGVNTYELAAPGTLMINDFLNSIVDAQGNPTEAFQSGTGYGNFLSKVGVGANPDDLNNIISTVQQLKAQARKNPAVNNMILKRMMGK